MSQSSSLTKTIHPIAGGIAFLLILSFLSATLIAEFNGEPSLIATVKSYILCGIFFLIPASIAAGGSGFKMVKRVPKSGILARKAKRMKIIGANGLLVLVPCAITLDTLASQGDFGTVFLTVQGIELIAGPINLILMGLNMKDGFSMTKGRRSK